MNFHTVNFCSCLNKEQNKLEGFICHIYQELIVVISINLQSENTLLSFKILYNSVYWFFNFSLDGGRYFFTFFKSFFTYKDESKSIFLMRSHLFIHSFNIQMQSSFAIFLILTKYGHSIRHKHCFLPSSIGVWSSFSIHFILLFWFSSCLSECSLFSFFSLLLLSLFFSSPNNF